MPAGTEIKVLIPGTNRPQKTKETPYLSNHFLLLIRSLDEIPKYFPFFSKKFASLFHLLIFLDNTKVKSQESFQVNPKILKYKNLIFVDKQKTLPMALLFLMELEVLCSLKT